MLRSTVCLRSGAWCGTRAVLLAVQATVPLATPHRNNFHTFTKKDEDDLVRIVRTKPNHVLKHVRQQVWRSRKRELLFRNTVTQLMIVVQDHLRKQLLDPQQASSIMEGVLEECVKFGQHDMAHLLFRAFLRFRKYGCAITVDALRFLFESYKETDSSQLMLQLAAEMKDDPALRPFCIAAYLFAGHTEEAEAIRATLDDTGITTQDYIAMIDGYAKLQQVDKVLELIRAMPTSLPPTGESQPSAASSTAVRDWSAVFLALFRVAHRLNDERLFSAVLDGAIERKISFTPEMFASILRHKMRRVTSVEEIASIEEELKGLGFVADITSNSIIIAAYARLIHFGDKGSEEVILAKVDTLLSSIEARLRQGDPDADISTAHLRAVIRGYGAAGKPELIKSAWQRMQHKDLSADPRVYNELMKWFALMGSVKDVLELLDDMKAKSVNHDAQTYTWALRALSRFYPRHTEELYQDMRRRGVRPDITLFNALIGSFGDLGLKERVEELIAEMKRREEAGTLQFNSNTYAVLLRIFADDLERVDALYKEAVEKNLAQHNHVCTTMLHVLAKQPERKERLDAFLAAMPEWTTDTYNVLVNMYGKQGNKEKVIELFDKMKAEQVAMNDVTYGTFVTAFARFKDSERVHEVVELLKAQQGTVSAHFYSVLASSLNRLGDATGVQDAWDDLLSSKLFPDTEVYNQFLSLYGRQHNTQKMQGVLDSMMKHVAPNPVTSTTVLDMLGKTGRVFEMEQLFEQMKQSPDTQPTSVTYHQVLNAFSKTGDVVKMEKVREEMLSKGFSENAVTFNILADGYGRAKRFEQIKELLERRRQAGVAMDELGYCVLITAFGRAKQATELHRLATEVKAAAASPPVLTTKVVWTLIDAFCRCQDVPNMELWIQELASLSPGGTLTMAQEAALISYYSRVGVIDKVDEIASRLESEGHQLSYGALNALAKGYSRAGQFEKTVAILHKMRDRNLVPDSSTTLSLSNAFLKAGLHEQAQQVVEWRRQYAKLSGAEGD